MRLALPTFVRRHTRLWCATSVAIAVAATTTLAQLGTFNPAFDGELWGVRHELIPANNGTPAGVVFVDGTLYVADSANDVVIAYDAAGNVVPKPGAQWVGGDNDVASPVSGMELYALGAGVVAVDGTDRDAILISDEASNRVAAFDTDGAHLFTLRLTRPETESPLLWLTLGQVAMSTGATFTLNTSTQSLTLNGTFVAAWSERLVEGTGDTGAMVFPSATTFVLNGAEFAATPDLILRGNEENAPAAPAAIGIFGVTFDAAGNLYVLDSFTERLHVYGPTFARLFTFGTPVAGGGTADFFEPWGLAYWPDANGGRLFVNDTYNGRILVYRPTDTPSSAPGIDALSLESQIKGFVAPEPRISLFAIAVEPSSGSIAVTDFADSDDNAYPRAVVLHQPNLAAFNLQVLSAQGTVVQSVCTGVNYKVRFSLTVPPNRDPVTNVLPVLLLNQVPTSAAAAASATYPSPLTLSEGQVATFTYTLTAGTTVDDIELLASATGGTADILGRSGLVSFANCAGETGPSTVTATPNLEPQVSGWTPVLENELYSVTLAATDPDGVASIEYRLEGANHSGDQPVNREFDAEPPSASFQVALPEFGRSVLYYRARDGNGIWSPLQTLNLRPKQVVDRLNNENGVVEFRVGDPEGIGIEYSVSGLPPGATFAANTGQFGGTISFDAADPYSSNPIVASGVYPVVVTETAPGGATSTVGFTWTINHLNRPPVITNPPILAGSLTINRGLMFTLDIEGMDPDGDAAVFTLYGRGINQGHLLPDSITIDPVTGLISGIFPADADPAYDFSVALAECGEVTPAPPCDAQPLPGPRLVTYFHFQVAVLDFNQPADIVSPGPRTNAENDAVTLTLEASDPDGDILTFEADGLPPGLSIARLDSDTAIISGTVAWGSAGSYAVTVTADDQIIDETRSVTFSWLITHTNRPPSLAIPDKISSEGGPATGAVSATDPDATDTLTYSALGLPPGAVMSTSGVFAGGFNYNAAGAYPVTVTVSDGMATTSDTFTWTVENVNRPPVVLNPGTQTSLEGAVILMQVSASDLDLQTLTYSAIGLPAGLTLDAVTGVIGGTIAHTAVLNYTVTVKVSDGSLLDTKTFTWNIIDVNRAPVCRAATASPGVLWPPNHKPVSIRIAGITDPDGGTPDITFNSILQDEPTNGKGDGNTTQDAGIENDGTRAWVRAERMGGENGRVYILGFTATDGKESCSGTVSVGVPHDKGNHNQPILSAGRWDSITGALVTPPPPIANDDSVSVAKGARKVIAVGANDEIYGPAGITLVSAPLLGTATVNANGTISYQAPAATGSTSFTYQVTNSAGSDTAVVKVTITKK